MLLFELVRFRPRRWFLGKPQLRFSSLLNQFPSSSSPFIRNRTAISSICLGKLSFIATKNNISYFLISFLTDDFEWDEQCFRSRMNRDRSYWTFVPCLCVWRDSVIGTRDKFVAFPSYYRCLHVCRVIRAVQQRKGRSQEGAEQIHTWNARNTEP